MPTVVPVVVAIPLFAALKLACGSSESRVALAIEEHVTHGEQE